MTVRRVTLLLVLLAVSVRLEARATTGEIDGGELYKKMVPSVVRVSVMVHGVETSFGAGFFVSPDGQFLSNYHVLKPLAQGVYRGEVVTNDGKRLKFDIGECDESLDLCILKTTFTPSRWFDLSRKTMVDPGRDVFVIGHPQGLEFSIARGIINGIRETKIGETTTTTISKDGKGSGAKKEDLTRKEVQLSASISPGNSGGPAFDKDGNLVGIVFYYLTGGQNLNFALHVDAIRQFTDRFRKSPKWVDPKTFAKASTESTRRLARRWADNALDPAFKMLKEGKTLNEADFTPAFLRLNLADRKDRLVARFRLPKVAFDGKCSAAEISGGVRMNCWHGKDAAFSFELFLPSPRLNVADLKGKTVDATPLPIVDVLKKKGIWDGLSAMQRKFMYSVPRAWSCAQVKRKKGALLDGAARCSASEYNEYQLDATGLTWYFQPKGRDEVLKFSVWARDASMSYFYYMALAISVETLDLTIEPLKT